MSDLADVAGGTSVLWADGVPLDKVTTQIAQARSKSAVKSGNFWSTPERDVASNRQDVIEMTLSGPRLVNFISFKTAHFPHTLVAEWQDPDTKVWQPFEMIAERPPGTPNPREIVTSPVGLVITDSTPKVVNKAAHRNQHPQHYGPGHWQYEAWKVRPVVCERARLVLKRIPGDPPIDTTGTPVPYSLGIQDWQVGYRINSRDDVPRYNSVVTEDDSFASTTDLLGSRVVYSLRQQGPDKAIDGNPQSAWRSEPQPVNYAVVNFYVDTRDSSGLGQVIDRFFVDPLTVGPHLNIYHSNDTPDADFDGRRDAITYPLAQTHGVAPVTRIFDNKPWADMVQFDTSAPSFVDISNAYLQFNAGRNWWIGLDLKMTADIDGYVSGESGADPRHHPWLSFGDNILRQNQGNIEFVTDQGDVLTFNLPAEHSIGSVARIALVYDVDGNDDFGPGLTLRYRIKGNVNTYEARGFFTIPPSRPETFSIGRYPDFNDPGDPGLWVRGLVVKQKATSNDEIDWFLTDGEDFVRDPQSPRMDTEATANALLRLHPLWAKTANPAGVVGGPGDRFEDMEWTPIYRDYSLRRGYLHLPPTRARYWKFEITKLTAEHYEVFVPIDRDLKMFPTREVTRYNQVRAGTWSAYDADGGVLTNQRLADTNLYSDAITQLSLEADKSAYSPTEALYLADPAQAEQASELGWIWRYQPWHTGLTAPRFVERQRHFYERVRVRHKTKVGFFAGIKTLRAYRVDYLKDDDTARYDDHFSDDANIASMNGIDWDADKPLISLGSYAEVVSKTFKSSRPVRALQFATQQSDAEQRLEDDQFFDPNLADHWQAVGDAEVIRLGPRNVVINRGWAANHYGELADLYSTYGGMEGHLYGELEGGEPTGQVLGGIQSLPFTPSGSGRVYAVTRVTSEGGTTAPVRVEIVSTEGDIVLASEEQLLQRGEVADIWVGYTPGQALDIKTYGDAEALGTYSNLESYEYQDLQAVAITGQVYARVTQAGQTSDSFNVQRISMFDNPIVWSFSVDDGDSWFDAMEIRNDPNGVLTFPDEGIELKWRAQVYRPGASISALSIRPWYLGMLAGQTPSHGMAQSGPNLSPVDLFPAVENDSMWQQWDNPIPRWWYQGLSMDPFTEDQEASTPLPEEPEEPTGPTHYVRYGIEDLRPSSSSKADTFNQADAPSITGGRLDTAADEWSVTGPAAFTISNNQARADLVPFTPETIAWVDGMADAVWEVRITQVGSKAGLVFRGDGIGNNYWVARHDGLWKVVAGTLTSVFPWPHLVSGTTLRVETQGSTIRVYANGTGIASVTDTFNQSATHGGLYAKQ